MPPQTYPILDNFSRNDEDPATGWGNTTASLATPIKVVGQRATYNLVGGSAYWQGGQFSPNQGALLTLFNLPSVGVSSRTLVRIQLTDAGFFTGYYSTCVKGATVDDWRIWRQDGTTNLSIAGPVTSPTLVAGDRILTEAIGNTITLWKYSGGVWTEVLSVVDTTYPNGGYVGLVPGLVVDDFAGGNPIPASPYVVAQPEFDPYEEPAQYANTTAVGGLIYEAPEITSITTIAAATGIQATPRTGVYDTDCNYRHSKPDDPLVYPGCTDCGSHLHDFFGNSSTDGFSTGASLLQRHIEDKAPQGRRHGCKDDGDGAAYWSPALCEDGTFNHDTHVCSGRLITPLGIHAYYRVYGTNREDIPKPYPIGFGMVSSRYDWTCSIQRDENKGSEIPPRCSGGQTEGCCGPNGFVAVVTFPDCWNGIDLYLPNSAHVKFRYSKGGKQVGPKCPPTHPVRIAELSLVIRYGDTAPGAHTYMLSSGDETTMHADFFNAWEADKQALLIQCCLNCERRNSWCQEDFHILPPPHDCTCP